MSILHRLPGERWSEVLRSWEGETVAILGGGPSLSAEAVQMLREAEVRPRMIAVNDSYLLAPDADVCYFADSEWWKWHTAGVARPILGLSADAVRKRFAEFAGEKCTMLWSGSNVTDERVHILQAKRAIEGDEHAAPISLDPKRLASGRNSVYQALNLALLAGAAEVLLLGLDGKAGPDGRNHWFGEHPRAFLPSVYEQQRRCWSAGERSILDSGARVINCNPLSAVDNFEKMTLARALSGSKAWA